MKTACLLVVLGCALFEATGYALPYYPYNSNVDSLSFGSSDNSRGGLVYSRYYNPYYNPRTLGGGMAAFMFRQPEEQQSEVDQPSQYYLPDRRRQTDTNYEISPQQNEVFYPQPPAKPIVTEATEIADPTEKTETFSTTVRAIVPELTEPEVEDLEEPEPVQKAKKRVTKKKQVKKPVEDDDDEDEYVPRFPAGTFFPMFFGWGGRRSSGGGPGGPIAVANAYSTARGGVASSHATAYGDPRPETKL